MEKASEFRVWRRLLFSELLQQLTVHPSIDQIGRKRQEKAGFFSSTPKFPYSLLESIGQGLKQILSWYSMSTKLQILSLFLARIYGIFLS